MKKILALLMSLILFLGAAIADSISLPEKIQMQVESGSGFKGKYSIAVSKDGKDNTIEGELRYLSAGDNSITELMNSDGKAYYFVNKKNEQGLYIADTVYSFTNFEDYKNSSLINIVSRYVNLPSTLSLIFSVANYSHDYNMETALLEKRMRDERNLILAESFERLKSKADLWLEKYMNTSSSKLKVGSSTELNMDYSVPYKDFKELLKTLVSDLKQDSFLTDALKQSMPNEYSALLLNLEDMEFIDFAIDSIDIDEDIKIGKSFSTKGGIKSSYLELPLVDKERGIYHIKYNQEQVDEGFIENILVTTQTGSLDISFTLSEKDDQKIYKGVFTSESNNDTQYSVSYNFNLISSDKAYVDESGKDHLDTQYELSISNNKEKSYKEADSYNIVYSRQLSSGVAKNVSTKLNELYSIENLSKKEKISFSLDAKTSAPFEIKTPTAKNVVLVDFENKKDALSVLEAVKDEIKVFCPDIENLKFYSIIFDFVSSDRGTSPQLPVEE